MPDSNPTADAAVDPLRGLRPDHPRLILTRGDVERLRRRRDTDADFADRVRRVRKRADEFMEAPVATYDIPDGKRLLATSRLVLDRVQTLALFARLDEDTAYAERAWRELEAAAAFPDWNPSHFLDTAEMAHAFGLGFDWLHHFLDEPRQTVIADAIKRHAFIPALPIYESQTWWSRSKHNWNAVCNGGLGVAALAIADREPDLARRVLRGAVAGLPFCLENFAPDGGWVEGAAYWVYSQNYLSYFLASCETALGHDFGLGDSPGLDRSALFVVHLNSPANGSFNFSDSGDGPVHTPALLYHARRYDLPAAAEHQLAARKPYAFDLVWHPDDPPTGALAARPLDYVCRGVECLTMRSAWHDPRASFLGIQCGKNDINHNRLDKGAFVYESRGVRWFLSLGADDYNQPEFFGKRRYDYYRNRAEGHNTLVVNPGDGPDQDPAAGGKVTHYERDDGGVCATLDLTPCYPAAGRVERRIDYRRQGGVTLTDEVRSATGEPIDLWWFAHTRAAIELDGSGRGATLRDPASGETLRVSLVEPARARFLDMPAQPLPASPHPEGQNPNDGTVGEGIRRAFNGPPVRLETPDPSLATRKLAIHIGCEAGARIVVRWDDAEGL